MLNIHSFLPRNIQKGKQSDIHKCKIGVMIVAYVMIAIIIVLSSESSYGHGAYAAEVRTESAAFEEPVLEEQEETAKFAQIQPEAVPMMVGNFVDKLKDEEERKEAERIQAIKEEALEKAAKEKADKEKKEKAAKEKAKKEKEQKAKEAAEAKKIKLSGEDKEVLLRIVEAEATGESVEGRMLVANVILNRVNSKQFPDTVKKVVFQKTGRKYQFSPIRDGRYYSVTISRKTRQAVERVLDGEDESQGALYFMARGQASKSNVRWFDNHLTKLMKYGGHEFYK